MTIDGTAPFPTPADAGRPAARDARTWKAAQDFEATTLGQLLQPMFDTQHTEDGLFGGGAGESSFRPMLVTEMAKRMEQAGGIGLAPAIYRQMIRMQEDKT